MYKCTVDNWTLIFFFIFIFFVFSWTRQFWYFYHHVLFYVFVFVSQSQAKIKRQKYLIQNRPMRNTKFVNVIHDDTNNSYIFYNEKLCWTFIVSMQIWAEAKPGHREPLLLLLFVWFLCKQQFCHFMTVRMNVMWPAGRRARNLCAEGYWHRSINNGTLLTIQRCLLFCLCLSLGLWAVHTEFTIYIYICWLEAEESI